MSAKQQESVLRSSNNYPAREQCVSAWEDLVGEIMAAGYAFTDDPPPRAPEEKESGSLLVIGSGIESVGFTRDSEAAIRAADRVFFCVADPATIVWIRKLRPDAYDLYVLYDDTKQRYHTYIQMTEAMLHPVRQGENVVAIYYGHPGVFVLSTHRAIQIARREGLRARMKPGISALDCLCADLGVDPCHPGMVTHEATDMLIRRRDPDIGLHVVLWQVGLIGQMGYRRRGFVNDRFPIFIEYLQSFYGEDYEVTHYVASRYPTLEPTIEVYRLSDLLNPANQSGITGLSTFYIAPKRAVDIDLDMAIRLGIVRPGQAVGPSAPVREIAHYGVRENRAIEEFANFRIPADYQHQPLTRASEFLIELTENMELYEIYRSDPERAVSDEIFGGLSEREKKALSKRNEGALQISAKGSTVSSSSQDSFVLALLRNSLLCRDLQRTIQTGLREECLRETFAAWLQTHDFDVRAPSIPSSARAVHAMLLLPWTGAYLDGELDFIVAVMGHPNTQSSLVICNGVRIQAFTYYNGALAWRAADGNPHSGLLRFEFESLRQGPRILAGTLSWPDAAEEEQVRFTGRDLDSLRFEKPDRNALEPCVGSYTARGLDETAAGIQSLAVAIDCCQLDDIVISEFAFEESVLSWRGVEGAFPHGRLQFITDPITGMRFFFGCVGVADDMDGKTNLCGHAGRSEDDVRLPAGLSEAPVSENVRESLQMLSSAAILERNTPFWNEWQKMRYTTQVVNRTLVGVVRRL